MLLSGINRQDRLLVPVIKLSTFAELHQSDKKPAARDQHLTPIIILQTLILGGLIIAGLESPHNRFGC